jgi:hypothetical protein
MPIAGGFVVRAKLAEAGQEVGELEPLRRGAERHADQLNKLATTGGVGMDPSGTPGFHQQVVDTVQWI